MPVPVIRFTKQMTPDERLQSLNKMWDWCQSPEADESKAKAAVLQDIVRYASKNLAITSRFSFMSYDQASEADCKLCDTIFHQADLPELLFLQYVINQINLKQTDPHPMKDEILPIVQQHKNTLIVPGSYEIRNIGMATFAFSFFMRFNFGLLLSAIIILFSKQLENMRISRELENKLALKETGGKVPPVGDRYDGAISRISNFSSSSYHTVATLFNTVILPAIQTAKKDISKPSLK